MYKTKKKLGDLLLEAGLIDELQLNSALSYQSEWGERLGSIIIKKGFASEEDVKAIIEKQLGLSCISLKEIEKPSDEVLNMVKGDSAKKYGIFPVRFEGKTLMIATSDPTDLKTLDDISFLLGINVKPLLALESDIISAIETTYEGGLGLRSDKEKLAVKISRSMPSEIDVESTRTTSADDKAETIGTTSKTGVSQKKVIESIIDLLISKGIFTKKELIDHIKSRG